MAYMSEEGYKQLIEELKYLESVERPKIVSAIAEANAKGKVVWNRVVGTGEKAGEGRGFDKGGGAAKFIRKTCYK